MAPRMDEWDSEVTRYKPVGGLGVPDDDYQAEILSVAYEEDKDKLVWKLRLLNGHGKDKVIYHRRLMDDKQKREWAFKDLMSIGMKARSWTEALDNLRDLTGMVIEVTLKTKGKYQNVWVNRAVRELAEEDVPF